MWLYALTLTERVSAGQIEDDWAGRNPGPLPAGVSQAGLVATVSSDQRVGGYDDFADQVAYVASIEEYRELPTPESDDWSPPYEAHPSGAIMFTG